MNCFRKITTGLLVSAALCAPLAQAPTGAIVSPTDAERAGLASIKGKIKGTIAWSTSRAHGNHDIWIMDADGSNPRALTESPDHVDWFSRISPDGKTVMFVRSKIGWVNEMDAEVFDKWDIWTIDLDRSNERKVTENATWGTWRPSGDSIVYVRGPKVFICDLAASGERLLFDAEEFFKKKKVYAQQPEMSPDGRFLAMTIRGARRETGIYSFASKQWESTGAGCEMSWYPDRRRLIRMNEGQGNGGTEVLTFTINENGAPMIKLTGVSIPKEAKFMDLKGRRSHEYFPRIDQQTGKWLIWGATQYGHEHDMADYELYVWDVTTDRNDGPVRLTFHDGNDRWPDLHIAQ